MRYFSRDTLISFSIIIASLIIGTSIIQGARIIARSTKAKEVDLLVKTIFDMEKALREKDASAIKAPGENLNIPPVGSRKVVGVTAGTNPVKGDALAPVLMVEFSDFQCPFSKKFYRQVYPLIEKEYISTGKVKFAYRDYPLQSHNLAKQAAIVIRCAGKQGKFWQMYDKILSGTSLEKDALRKYAQELGLNIKAYDECLVKSEMSDAVEADIKDARKLGVSGTPSFFINGRFVNGAYPFETFKKIIDEEIAQSKSK